MSYSIDRKMYASMYGPTTGDKVRLADTDLIIEVEDDKCTYGEEALFGGGKVVRDGMGQSQVSRHDGAVDTVITRVLIVDYTGIYKANVGIKDGKITSIGKAGNPDIQPDIDIIIGASTEIIAGEGKILTAGSCDTHTHFISPQQIPAALYSGTTTLFGGGSGPFTGTKATSCTSGQFHIETMLRAAEAFPVNIGLMGKGSSSNKESLIEQIKAGAAAFKIHEDWGATPSTIDTCLSVAENYDIQVAIHTDTLNEAGFLENTLKAFKNRCVHTFHSEGAGGGHAPDMLRVCGERNILPSSTNPTLPYTVNTIDEALDMLMVCHHLDKTIPEDIAFAESRIRSETIAAEDILHDLGAISIVTSDSQAMGRVGELSIRTWQTAHKMKQQRGLLPEDKERGTDNFRVRRYIAKYTINPCIAHGISSYVGSIEVGKLADLVLWEPAFFGVKPDIVLKGGQIVAAVMGEANASIPTPQPVYCKDMFGTFGLNISQNCLSFVSKAAIDEGIREKLELKRSLVPVFSTRNLSKLDMKYNNFLPKIEVDPEKYDVRANGELLTCDPAKELPLAQRYFLY